VHRGRGGDRTEPARHGSDHVHEHRVGEEPQVLERRRVPRDVHHRVARGVQPVAVAAAGAQVERPLDTGEGVAEAESARLRRTDLEGRGSRWRWGRNRGSCPLRATPRRSHGRRRARPPPRDAGGLVPGDALHPDRHPRRGVPPSADLVRAVHAAPGRVVGEHQRDLGAAGEHLRVEVAQRLERVRLAVAGGGARDHLAVGEHAAVVGRLERLEDVDGRPARGQEHRGVLRARDVPLQTLVDQQVTVRPARLLDLRGDQVDRQLLVRGAAVVGDDDPLEAVLPCLRGLRRDLVLRVRGEHRVDVVVPGEVPKAPVGVGRRGQDRRSARRRGSAGPRPRRRRRRARRHR
jgi:hypothetical protein